MRETDSTPEGIGDSRKTAADNNDENKINVGNIVSRNSCDKQVSTTNKSNNESSQDPAKEDAGIKMTFNNEEVIVKMYDNPTSRDLLTIDVFKNFDSYVKIRIEFINKK